MYATSKNAAARAISLEHKAVRHHRRFRWLRRIEKLLYRCGTPRATRYVRHRADNSLDFAMHCSFMAQHYLRRADARRIIEHERYEQLVNHPAHT